MIGITSRTGCTLLGDGAAFSLARYLDVPMWVVKNVIILKYPLSTCLKRKRSPLKEIVTNMASGNN